MSRGGNLPPAPLAEHFIEEIEDVTLRFFGDILVSRKQFDRWDTDQSGKLETKELDAMLRTGLGVEQQMSFYASNYDLKKRYGRLHLANGDNEFETIRRNVDKSENGQAKYLELREIFLSYVREGNKHREKAPFGSTAIFKDLPAAEAAVAEVYGKTWKTSILAGKVTLQEAQLEFGDGSVLVVILPMKNPRASLQSIGLDGVQMQQTPELRTFTLIRPRGL